MSTVLTVIGIILLIAGIIIGFLTGTFLSFLISVCIAVVLSVILFALSSIIERQEDIITQLNSLRLIALKPPKKIKCIKCEKIYDSNRTTCPFCGIKTPTDEE